MAYPGSPTYTGAAPAAHASVQFANGPVTGARAGAGAGGATTAGATGAAGCSTTGGGTTTGGGDTNSGGSLGGGRIEATVRTFWVRYGKRTRVAKLTVRNVPVGATVTVRCKGTGCPFKKRKLTMKGTQLPLARQFKKRKLAPGTVISIVVTKDGWVGKALRYKTRAGKFPKLTVS